MEPDKPKSRPSVSQLSKTPSWVMLGFILGAFFVWALPRRETTVRPIVLAPHVEKRVELEPRKLTTIEAVFDQWSQYAVWDDDVTQVALWNSASGDFAEFYEVRRMDGAYYFRSLPQLTHRVIRRGPPQCPLRFTETEEQYQERRQEGQPDPLPENPRPSLPLPRVSPVHPKPSVEPAPRSALPEVDKSANLPPNQ